MKIFQEKMKQIYSPKEFVLKITGDKACCYIYKKCVSMYRTILLTLLQNDFDKINRE